MSPLKKVDEIIEKVEGVKPPIPPVKPPPAETGEEETLTIPVAEAVPDKAGFVISPYNGKWIDVTGVKPGTLMADPHFTEEKKFFRVPEIVLPPAVEPKTPKADTESEDTESGEAESEDAESEGTEEEPPSTTDEAAAEV
ncbi:hypothetical protein [Haloferula sp.]|uniref:hypothetical protein n=1 Tax=Haloferula sp. TaxID=2497595 RepID=UPI003C7212C6